MAGFRDARRWKDVTNVTPAGLPPGGRAERRAESAAPESAYVAIYRYLLAISRLTFIAPTITEDVDEVDRRQERHRGRRAGARVREDPDRAACSMPERNSACMFRSTTVGIGNPSR